MKKLVIITYIAVVLLISGFAKASEFNTEEAFVQRLPITHFTYSGDHFSQLAIGGELPNPCLSMPQATVLRVDTNKNSIYISVTAEMTADFCIQKLGGPYDLAVDLRELLDTQNIHIDPHTIYTVYVGDAGFFKMPGSVLVPALHGGLALPEELTGTLEVTEVVGLSFWKFIPDDELLEPIYLHNDSIDFIEYQESHVRIIGHPRPTPGLGFVSHNQSYYFSHQAPPRFGQGSFYVLGIQKM